jgi:hypothetical protein
VLKSLVPREREDARSQTFDTERAVLHGYASAAQTITATNSAAVASLASIDFYPGAS